MASSSGWRRPGRWSPDRDLIFADEPTGNLDSRSEPSCSQIRQAVTESRQTVVMVTHDPGAAAYADRVVFLADGRVVRELRAPTADSVIDVLRELAETAGDAAGE